MWKENLATELPRNDGLNTPAKPITEEELQTIIDRLEATRDIFRQNRELREVLSRREGETRALHALARCVRFSAV